MQLTRSGRRLGAILVSLLLAPAASAGESGVPEEFSARALEILTRSVGFKTVIGEGQVPAYAAYLAGVLREGGFAAEDITITPHGETRLGTEARRALLAAARPRRSWRVTGARIRRRSRS